MSAGAILQGFIRYNGNNLFQKIRLEGNDTLLVFIHGLGDSHLNYQLFFEKQELNMFDIIVPDMLSHGKTSVVNDCTYAMITECLYSQLKPVICKYKKVILLPHSVAGIVATNLYKTDLSKYISGIFALETSITQYGSFLTESLAKAMSQKQSFPVWFSKFKNNIYQKGVEDNILRLYHTGLSIIDPQSFLKLALETRAIATEISNQEFTNNSGLEFVSLDVPKLYCLGKYGNQHQSVPFLKAYNVPIVSLPTDSHWVAQSCLSDFISKLQEFI